MNTRILKAVLLVPCALVLVGLLHASTVRAQQQVQKPEVQEPEKVLNKPAILSKPMDFSSAPEITKPIDGPLPS